MVLSDRRVLLNTSYTSFFFFFGAVQSDSKLKINKVNILHKTLAEIICMLFVFLPHLLFSDSGFDLNGGAAVLRGGNTSGRISAVLIFSLCTFPDECLVNAVVAERVQDCGGSPQ